MTNRWSHRFVTVNGVRLHYVETGSGPLVLLLHGFPELWYAWRHQIPALGAAGFHVIAPDLRGYNESEKPAGIENYRIETLTNDALGLIHTLGKPPCAVVGHDWGGVIAWQLAIHHPDAVDKLVILNAPHPARFLAELRTPSQLRKSWYVFFFQLPRVPEWLIRAGGYAGLRRTLRTDPARPDAFTETDIRHYRAALAQPGALTAAINYYRALRRGDLFRLHPPHISVRAPTLLIWGERDRYLNRTLTKGLEQWVPRLRIERFPDASHWVQADAPEQVNRLIIDFLGAEQPAVP